MGPDLFGNYFRSVVFATLDPVLSPASPQARALSSLFVVTLLVCGVIFVIVMALVVTCILRFRRQPNSPEPKQVTGNEKLEITWTTLSILVLVGLFALTVHAMHVSDPPADQKPSFTVIGHQWWWEVRYPNGAVAANEIHIPVGSNLLVRVESVDVIHDFWVPELGRKMDMIPGNPNHIWIRADSPGEYLGACSEYCGAEHAWMRIRVVAQPPAEFREWVEQQRQPAPAPVTDEQRRGLRLFQDKTCVVCHTIRGVNQQISVAPELTHIASRETLGAGVALNTPVTLRRWIADPQLIKPGCYMPNFHLTDQQVNDLTQYLETLK